MTARFSWHASLHGSLKGPETPFTAKFPTQSGTSNNTGSSKESIANASASVSTILKKSLEQDLAGHGSEIVALLRVRELKAPADDSSEESEKKKAVRRRTAWNYRLELTIFRAKETDLVLGHPSVRFASLVLAGHHLTCLCHRLCPPDRVHPVGAS